MSGSDIETAGAECENLPLDEAVELFFPTSEGGHLRRSKPWPKPDAHEEARRLCGHCRVLADCLVGALEEDGWTFRGGMSPEERGVFGGFRDRDARKRAPYLTGPQVAARLVDAGMDVAAIAEVISAHQEQLSEPESDDTFVPVHGATSMEALARLEMREEYPTTTARRAS